MQEYLEQLYHFLFETFDGIIILVVGGIFVSAFVSLILEIRSRRIANKKITKEEDSQES